jgi:hypothetical protein
LAFFHEKEPEHRENLSHAESTPTEPYQNKRL